MPITDLTGTKWIFNAEISTPSSNENYSIDFSNGVNDYNLFSIGKQDGKTAA